MTTTTTTTKGGWHLPATIAPAASRRRGDDEPRIVDRTTGWRVNLHRRVPMCRLDALEHHPELWPARQR